MQTEASDPLVLEGDERVEMGQERSLCHVALVVCELDESYLILSSMQCFCGSLLTAVSLTSGLHLSCCFQLLPQPLVLESPSTCNWSFGPAGGSS